MKNQNDGYAVEEKCRAVFCFFFDVAASKISANLRKNHATWRNLVVGCGNVYARFSSAAFLRRNVVGDGYVVKKFLQIYFEVCDGYDGLCADFNVGKIFY
jgi:hypothetical protein